MPDIAPEIQFQIDQIQKAIFGENIPTIDIVSDGRNPYLVDWENRKINFSLKADFGLSDDIDVAVHELAHFMIASNDGLHLPAWGMKNPYYFWDGERFSDMPAPDGSPASNTETKVWAWQHLIYVMAGMRDMDAVDKRPEAQWVGDAPRENMLDIIDGMIRGHIADIQRQFPNGTWQNEIKRKFHGITELLEHERALNPDGSYEMVSETYLGYNVYVLLEHNNNGWFQSILAHKDSHTGEYDGYHTHVITRSPERVQAFVKAAEKVFDEREFIQRPHLISVTDQNNLESISQDGLNPKTYFIDSQHASAENLVAYYSECLTDEGKIPVVLAVEKTSAMMKMMEPDYPSIDEPIITALGVSESDVHSSWEMMGGSTSDCLSLVGSCRSTNTIPSHKVVILENEKDFSLNFRVRDMKVKKNLDVMRP